MNKYLVCGLFFFIFQRSSGADTLELRAPSGHLRLQVWMDAGLKYTIAFDQQTILQTSSINLVLDQERALSLNNGIKRHAIRSVNSHIISPVPEKRKWIPDIYNELTIDCKQPYSVVFRVYDDGVAYHIATRFKDSIFIKNESAEFCFPGKPAAWFPEIHPRDGADIFHTSFEELYPLKPLDSLTAGSVGYSPVLVMPAVGPRIAITESGLEDYPGMFLEGTGGPVLKALFAGYPLAEKVTGGLYPQAIVTKRADFIARTCGTRDLPWRVLLVAPEDRDLPVNDLVYRLAPPSRVEDPSWIHPGKGTDEWIINTNLFNVPFKSGINTATYKYYIDFAKRFGFDRIM